jgi:hypothetical protein
MPKPSYFHLTASVLPTALDLCRADTGAWLWTHLRTAFLRAIAVTLMPDHPHIVTPSDDPEVDRERLARLLGQLGRSFGVRGRISETPAPAPIRDRDVLARQVRYVALNPCRARLVRCPLAWQWSTHRDVVGACVDPWVAAQRLAVALGQPQRDFVARHHAYVSGDPHARIEGTSLPSPARPSALPKFTLREIAEAVAAATRQPLREIRRRSRSRALFVALAHDQGWRNLQQLATACACGRHAIQRAVVDPEALAAARLCLGDARLRGPGTSAPRNATHRSCPPHEQDGW